MQFELMHHPFFFQPVEEGTTLLVEGGIVAILHHFVFSVQLNDKNKATQRILSFMLEASEDRQRANDLIEFIVQLTSLAIDGATDIRTVFTPDVASIVIPTGSIGATDYAKMYDVAVDALVKNGRAATESFIQKELLNTSLGPATERSIWDEHEAFLKVTEQLYVVRSEVLVSLPDTRWFWELFPTVLHWRARGIRVICYVPPVLAGSSEAAKENQRRNLMQGIGIVVHEKKPTSCLGIPF